MGQEGVTCHYKHFSTMSYFVQKRKRQKRKKTFGLASHTYFLELPSAAIPEYHWPFRLGGSNDRNVLSQSSGSQKSKIKKVKYLFVRKLMEQKKRKERFLELVSQLSGDSDIQVCQLFIPVSWNLRSVLRMVVLALARYNIFLSTSSPAYQLGRRCYLLKRNSTVISTLRVLTL